MQNCNFTDCLQDPLNFIDDGYKKPTDNNYDDKVTDDGKKLRKHNIHCPAGRFYYHPYRPPSIKSFTCTEGEPWRPYPLPICRIG